MNYWNTKQIHWHDFSPESIFIKRNKISSQFEDEIQTCSYQNKTGFYHFLEEQQDKHSSIGVCVRLHSLKDEFPCAEIDFLKYGLNKKYSNGEVKFTSANAIAYITSNHRHKQYTWDQNTNSHVLKQGASVARDDEGYQVHFSANQSQYGGDRRECQEMLDISWAVVGFLIERVLPLHRENKMLTSV
jgi:hypothetical protein